MEILLLSPHPSLIETFKMTDDRVVQTTAKVDTNFVKNFDWIVCYGYRHILTRDVLDLVPAMNLHMSYLPWNRGADPNYWSWVDGTKKGYTIHLVDEGLDTGDILIRTEIPLEAKNETLATSYNTITKHMEDMFRRMWPALRMNRIQGLPQSYGNEKGSYHRSSEKPILLKGWDTPVKELIK